MQIPVCHLKWPPSQWPAIAKVNKTEVKFSWIPAGSQILHLRLGIRHLCLEIQHLSWEISYIEIENQHPTGLLTGNLSVLR